MTETTTLGVADAAPGATTSAEVMNDAPMLSVYKEDFMRRLDFLAAYIELWTGHPERRTNDMPISQLREEWRHEGVVVRALMRNLSSAGRSLVKAIEKQSAKSNQ